MKIINVTGKKPESWYRANGEPVYDADLRAARKESLLPRVSNILSVWPKPFLEEWKAEQLLLSAATLPPLPGEPPDAYAHRVVEDSKKEAEQAAQWGTEFHRLVEAIMVGQDIAPAPEFILPIDEFYKWHNENVVEPIAMEHIVTNVELGYAGRLDLFFVHKTLGKVLADIKTRNVKNGKPAWYDEQAMQLWAYRQALPDAQVHETPDACLSIVINRNSPEPPYTHVWDDDEMDMAGQRFKACLHLWQLWKKYNPTQTPQ